MRRLALIDGDEVAFKACAVTATTVDWQDGEASQAPAPSLAMKAAKELISAWSDKVDADDILVCLSCKDRKLFRRDLSPSYKTERTEKPDAYWRVIEMFERDYETEEIPGLEADDVMGLRSASTDKVQPIIVSSDKDMKTVAGAWIYAPYHATKKRISQYDGDRAWMSQTLTGDTSDGYKGLPKCGPKCAEKTLEGRTTLREMWSAVAGAYGEKGFPLEDAVLQARLARILRPGDYQDGKVKLWTP